MIPTPLAAPPASRPFQLDFKPRRRLTDQEELAFYRVAYRATPDAANIRFSFARLLLALSQFAEAANLLKEWAIDEFLFIDLAIRAQLGLKTAGSVEDARRLCVHGLGVCETDVERSAIHYLLADCLLRQLDFEAARAALMAALEVGGYQHAPYSFLLRSEITRGRAAELAAYTERWLAARPPAAGLIAAQVLAQAQLGRIEEAVATQGLDRFLRHYEPAAPPGWESLAAFNHDLALEIAHHPSLRDKVVDASSRKTRHVPQPDIERSRVYHAFQEMIRREVVAYCAALPEDADHPFLRMRGASGLLSNWCVLTEGEGHETWHQHPGWLSGTYYVQVPEHIANGTGKEGCIAFGLPDDCASEEDARRFGETLCRPRAGLLVFFPSYVHHRTYAHGGLGQRICCAFDVEVVK